MDTGTLIRRLENLLEEYELSNDNAVCALYFKSVEIMKQDKNSAYIWDGEKLSWVHNPEEKGLSL